MAQTADAPTGDQGTGEAPAADDVGGARRAPPYLGLATYGDSDGDAELFFGREAERDLVIANLLAARITVLYGPSGVGKSSLLHAGVAHHLRESRSSPVIVIDDWDHDPTGTLMDAVRAAAIDESGTGDPNQPLGDAVDALARRRAPALLIILDQFEEYLRRHPAPSPGGFDDAVAELLAPGDAVARVLIGVRADRLADLDRLEGRVPDLFGNVLRLDPLTPAAAREAIVGPVELYNRRRKALEDGPEVALEPGLAERVLTELGELDEAGVSPAFLSLTMRRLWDADIGSGGTTLRVATLAALGGATRIFASHLAETMASLTATEQRLGAEILRYLVTPSGTMQRFSSSDLAAYVSSSQSAVTSLAEKLARPPARIIKTVETPTKDGTRTEYELAHQVLAAPALEWRTEYTAVRLERRSTRLLVALVAVTAIAVALAGYVVNPGVLGRLELHTVDARFSVRGQERPDPGIVLVTVADNAALQRLGAGGQGAARATFARALDEIRAARPRVVVADVVFTGPSSRPKAPRDDEILGAAFRRLGPRLVLATDQFDNNGQTELLGLKGFTYGDAVNTSHPEIAWAGFPGNPQDPGAVIRNMERDVSLFQVGEKHPVETEAVVAARVAGVPERTIARLPRQAWIDFRGGDATFPAVPFYAVAAGQPRSLSLLRNRVVVVGLTAPKANDMHDTSAPGKSVMSGPELQAEAISTALRGFPLRDAGLGIDVALIVLMGLIPLVLALLVAPGWCAAGVVAAGILFCVGAQLAFDSGRVVNVVFPLASLVLSGLGVLVVAMWRGRPRAAPAAG